mmetsp:Transcript_17805/g.35201  ORF Transcript_17805/g.35201 Transcript_17805/m.35201 type:complete len:105 (+) Transcript_17805:3601-3915(+)
MPLRGVGREAIICSVTRLHQPLKDIRVFVIFAPLLHCVKTFDASEENSKNVSHKTTVLMTELSKTEAGTEDDLVHAKVKCELAKPIYFKLHDYVLKQGTELLNR